MFWSSTAVLVLILIKWDLKGIKKIQKNNSLYSDEQPCNEDIQHDLISVSWYKTHTQKHFIMQACIKATAKLANVRL